MIFGITNIICNLCLANLDNIKSILPVASIKKQAFDSVDVWGKGLVMTAPQEVHSLTARKTVAQDVLAFN